MVFNLVQSKEFSVKFNADSVQMELFMYTRKLGLNKALCVIPVGADRILVHLGFGRKQSALRTNFKGPTIKMNQ